MAGLRAMIYLALNTLLDRLHNLRLDPDMPAPVIRGLTFRGVDAVNVNGTRTNRSALH